MLADITGAEVQGAELGSLRLYFCPGPITGGSRRSDIGTAGAVSLVFQAILAPLAFADKPSELLLRGGTHVPWSPAAPYISEVFLPVVERMGLAAAWHVERGGFYPKGGGTVRAAVQPLAQLASIDLTERGALLAVRGVSAVAALPRTIAERQADRVRRRLGDAGYTIEIEIVEFGAACPGDSVFLWAEFERARAGFGALGERGKPAERVADEAADDLLDFLSADVTTEGYLADQLVVLMALADGRSTLTTARVSQHLLTNLWTVQQFLPIRITLEGRLGEPGRLCIDGVGLKSCLRGRDGGGGSLRERMVRKAQTTDVPAISQLIQLYAGKGDLLPVTLQEFYDRISDFYVVEQDGQIVGVCSLFIYGADLAEIRSLAVRPEYEGKGIGRAVTEACIVAAKARAIKRVFGLTDKPAFFERLGFRVVDRLTLPEKVWKDCRHCSKWDYCDEVAVLLEL